MTQFAAWVSGKNVPFQRHRYSISTDMQEGVADAGDYKVIQRAAGANMSVDVGLGKAWVQVDTGARNGLGFAFSDAVENPAIGASHATLPRLDQVVLQWNDSALPAGVGGDVPTVRVIAGVATAGATLDNRNGAAALPNDCLRLADVLVPAASTSVVTANIRDRRTWARGAYRRIVRTQNAAAGSHYSTASSAFNNIDGTNLFPRIECSGVPVRSTLRGRSQGTLGNTTTFFQPIVDSAVAEAGGGDMLGVTPGVATAELGAMGIAAWEFVPAAGSHLIGWNWRATSSTSWALASASTPLVFVIEELVRQNADNT